MYIFLETVNFCSLYFVSLQTPGSPQAVERAFSTASVWISATIKITLQLTANKRIHPRWFEQGMAVYHQLLPQIKSPHPTTSAFTPSPPPSKLLAKVAILNLDLIRAPNAETHTCSSSKPKQLSKNPLKKERRELLLTMQTIFEIPMVAKLISGVINHQRSAIITSMERLDVYRLPTRFPNINSPIQGR